VRFGVASGGLGARLCGMGSRIPKGGRAWRSYGYGFAGGPEGTQPTCSKPVSSWHMRCRIDPFAGPSSPTDGGRTGSPNAEDVMAERKKGSTSRGGGRSSGRGGGKRSSSGRGVGSRSEGGSRRSSGGQSGGKSGGGRSASGASSRGSGSSRGASSSRGGASRRGGLGDEQGTRVGSSESGGRSGGSSRGYRGPSTQPVSEGLEGSVLEGARGSGDTSGQRGSMGAGSEATEGIHGASSRRGESSRTSTTKAGTGSRETGSSSTRSTTDRSGSEPMRGSEQQHVSGYGGAGGTPKTSSDQPARNREQPLGGSRKRGSRAQGRLGDEEAGDGM
jgi:hypothetical protein